MTSHPSFMKVKENEENAMLYPELSETVFDAVYEVHRELGPGLLELPYRNALYYALRERGLCGGDGAALCGVFS
jgi:hypothetical protein